MSSANVTHYYETGGPANLFACGLYDDDREGSPYRSDVTCPDCLAIASPPEPKTVTHYAKDSMGRAQCGAEWPDGRITAWKQDTTCPACLAELDVAEAVNLVPTDPAALAAATAGLEAEFPDDDAPAIACSQVHEHDDVACAAPSSAEMTLDVVGAKLSALWVRIEEVFDNDGDRQFALEGAQREIGDLLGLLGLPVPAPAGTE